MIIFNIMKQKLVLIAIVFFGIAGCKQNNKEIKITETKVITSQEQKEASDAIALEIYDFNGVKQFLEKKDGKTYVVNFWATWCAPCVKELPYFEKLNVEYANKQVEVILISLDFPHIYEAKLKPFIKNRGIKSKVVVLDDPDMNTWIPKVSEYWSGGIPATLIYNNDIRKFYEQSFNYEELEEKLNLFIN